MQAFSCQSHLISSLSSTLTVSFRPLSVYDILWFYKFNYIQDRYLMKFRILNAEFIIFPTFTVSRAHMFHHKAWKVLLGNTNVSVLLNCSPANFLMLIFFNVLSLIQIHSVPYDALPKFVPSPSVHPLSNSSYALLSDYMLWNPASV